MLGKKKNVNVSKELSKSEFVWICDAFWDEKEEFEGYKTLKE